MLWYIFFSDEVGHQNSLSIHSCSSPPVKLENPLWPTPGLGWQVMCSGFVSLRHFEDLVRDLTTEMSDSEKSGPPESVSLCLVALARCQRKRDIPAWLHAGVTDNREGETPPRRSFRQTICWWQHVSPGKTLHRYSSEAPVAPALTKHSPGSPPRLRPCYCHHHTVVCACFGEETKTNQRLNIKIQVCAPCLFGFSDSAARSKIAITFNLWVAFVALQLISVEGFGKL